MEFTPDQIVVSTGAKQSIANVVLCLINPGDEVIVPAPYWVSYPEMVKLAGGVPKTVFAGIESGFKITPEQLRAAITPKTRMVIINSPSNPTGAVYTRAELEALVAICVQANVWIMSDEIYENLVYDGQTTCSPATFSPEAARLTITVSGYAKSYSMTGWRLGWGLWPDNLVRDAERMQINSASCASAPVQVAAIEALRGPQDAVDVMLKAFDERRHIITEELNSVPGFSCILPKGAFYAFPNIKATGLGSKQLEEKLLHEAGVAVLAGNSFGHLGEGYLRFSYASSVDEIRSAVGRVRDLMSKS